MTSRPLVSVVTPFYNTAEHLAECIESVLEQSYRDFEYILLDNLSTDGSRKIAEAYAARDPRIRLLCADTFVAQLPNYNRALRTISPESRYVKLVQADDWIYPECLSLMVRLAEEHPEVGIVSSFRLKGIRVEGDGLPADASVLEGRDAARLHFLGGRFLFGSPTTLLYRSELVRSREDFFTEASLHADTEACYEILRDWDFGFVHQVLSFSRVREGSIVKTMEEFDPHHVLDKLLLVLKYGEWYLSQGEVQKLRKRLERRCYGHLARQFLQGRGRRVWTYHRERLASAGGGLQTHRLLWHLVLESLRPVLPGGLARMP